ncbi:ErfK/YbiS/YcfS/YnhG family protein [Mycolicibacterium aurum]|uniref:ErfK/YbiS/YcfS/YnhG family protein n=1 Tax=Mycolicibacterium aurum TaxID=1791 RepID=A0A3S4RIA3_MYCAU|nr:L,D-transpeptidase [Mycolicibacterium aurum]VEG51090.1 ErfK/YbiS/YcfS/YnhG family protein [Mycolicibacterium aurum]
MRQRNRSRLIALLMTMGVAAGLTLAAPAALAQPLPAPAPVPAPAPPPANPFVFPNPFAPPAPAAPAGPTADDPFAVVPGQPMAIPEGTPAGQNPTPFVGQPPFVPPSFNPTNGSIAGAAKPIYINFQRPIANRQMAEDAVHISSVPPVPGRFYWTSDTQLRWRPQDFWPAGTVVNIDAAGTKSSFTVPEQLVATVDDSTKQMEIMRDGVLEKTFPVSMGKSGYETKNGTYYVLEKFDTIVMDSSTYGVPVDDPSGEGYKLKVKDAVRIDNSGVFVHGAPWSEGSQGESNVSHGCINLSAEDAAWFRQNFGSGDAVVIKNTDGGTYTQPDGASDWQMF